MSFSEYYRLTKPGIIYGNALTALAGFFLAAHHAVNILLLCAMLLGLSLVIASACVFNNYFDRDIDAVMVRTKQRALPTQRISNLHAIVFASILGTFGILTLFFFTNVLTLAIAIFGFLVYVFVYTPAKRWTVYSTHIGALAGAVPPVVGYVSFTNALDTTAILLFVILALWQMPHFFSIALYRIDEYGTARVPVWSIQKGSCSTQIQILLYCILYAVAALSLAIVANRGYTYAVIMVVFCLTWFVFSVRGLFVRDVKPWARQMFFFSLIILIVWCGLLIII